MNFSAGIDIEIRSAKARRGAAEVTAALNKVRSAAKLTGTSLTSAFGSVSAGRSIASLASLQKAVENAHKSISRLRAAARSPIVVSTVNRQTEVVAVARPTVAPRVAPQSARPALGARRGGDISSLSTIKVGAAAAAASITDLTHSFSGLGAAVGAVGFAALINEMTQSEAAFRAVNISMRVSAGSAEAGAAAYAFVANEAERIGVNLRDVAPEFAKLSVGAKAAGLSLSDTQSIFTGVAEASTAMGLSGEQVAGAFRAITQIASKGKVQAEELRGQLAERIPGAVGIMARGLGIAEAQLNKLLEKGMLPAGIALKALAKGLKETFGPQALAASQSFYAVQARLQNTWDQFLRSSANAGVFDAVIDSMKRMTEILRDPATITGAKSLFEDVAALGKQLSGFAAGVASAFMSLPSIVKEIGLFGAAFFGKKGFLVLSLVLSGINKWQESILLVKAAFEGVISPMQVIGAMLDKWFFGLTGFADKIDAVAKTGMAGLPMQREREALAERAKLRSVEDMSAQGLLPPGAASQTRIDELERQIASGPTATSRRGFNTDVLLDSIGQGDPFNQRGPVMLRDAYPTPLDPSKAAQSAPDRLDTTESDKAAISAAKRRAKALAEAAAEADAAQRLLAARRKSPAAGRSVEDAIERETRARSAGFDIGSAEGERFLALTKSAQEATRAADGLEDVQKRVKSALEDAIEPSVGLTTGLQQIERAAGSASASHEDLVKQVDKLVDAEREATSVREDLLTPTEKYAVAASKLRSLYDQQLLSSEQLAKALNNEAFARDNGVESLERETRERESLAAIRSTEPGFMRGVQRYRQSLPESLESMEAVGQSVAQSLDDGLTEAFTRPTKAAEAFKNTLLSIQQAFVKRAVQQFITKPLLDMVFGAEGGGAAPGTATSASSAVSSGASISTGSATPVSIVNADAVASPLKDTIGEIGRLFQVGLSSMGGSLASAFTAITGVLSLFGGGSSSKNGGLRSSLGWISTIGGIAGGIGGLFGGGSGAQNPDEVSINTTRKSGIMQGHSGGLTGALRMQRLVSRSIFENAPRFAAGGRVGMAPGEVPIIAHTGEAVVPLPDGRTIPVTMRGGASADSNVNVYVTNAPAESKPAVRSQRGADGTVDIFIEFERRLADRLSSGSGPMARAIPRSFNASRRPETR